MNNRDKLLEDFSAMLAQAETLMKRANTETGDAAEDLRRQVESSLLAAKHRLQALESEAVGRARDAGRATDSYVHDNPWQAIGSAAAGGFVAGLMMNRR